jgi:hypothetical protein
MRAVRPAVTFVVLCIATAPVWARGNISHFIEQVSCDSGPYALKLPKSYDELRKLGPLKGERLVREEDLGGYKARYKDLLFNGLRLGVVTYTNDPQRYQIVSAEIRSPQWRIAGPLRTGQALPARIGDVETKTLPASATHEFSGEEDTVRVQVRHRRIIALTYLCVAD